MISFKQRQAKVREGSNYRHTNTLIGQVSFANRQWTWNRDHGVQMESWNNRCFRGLHVAALGGEESDALPLHGPHKDLSEPPMRCRPATILSSLAVTGGYLRFD